MLPSLPPSWLRARPCKLTPPIPTPCHLSTPHSLLLLLLVRAVRHERPHAGLLLLWLHAHDLLRCAWLAGWGAAWCAGELQGASLQVAGAGAEGEMQDGSACLPAAASPPPPMPPRSCPVCHRQASSSCWAPWASAPHSALCGTSTRCVSFLPCDLHVRLRAVGAVQRRALQRLPSMHSSRCSAVSILLNMCATCPTPSRTAGHQVRMIRRRPSFLLCDAGSSCSSCSPSFLPPPLSSSFASSPTAAFHSYCSFPAGRPCRSQAAPHGRPAPLAAGVCCSLSPLCSQMHVTGKHRASSRGEWS